MADSTSAPVLGEPLPVELMNTIWADRDGVHDALASDDSAAAWLGAVAGDRLPMGTAQGASATPQVAARFRELRDALRRLAAVATRDTRIRAASATTDFTEAVAAVNRASASAPSWAELAWAGNSAAEGEGGSSDADANGDTGDAGRSNDADANNGAGEAAGASTYGEAGDVASAGTSGGAGDAGSAGANNGDAGATFQVRSAGAGADAALAWIADQAVRLFAGPERSALRACQGPGCVLYFVRNHPRREWCSAGCGNRARVARHYQRHHAGR